MRKKLGEAGLTSDDTRSNISFQENAVSYKAKNKSNKRVLCYNVDGGMFKQDVKKCDKAIGLPNDNSVYLIELKGCDFKKACEQISETLINLGDKIANLVVHGRVVCSRIPKPDIRSTQVVRLERALAKTGGTLVKAAVIMEEVI